jgi:hypothetical protein
LRDSPILIFLLFLTAVASYRATTHRCSQWPYAFFLMAAALASAVLISDLGCVVRLSLGLPALAGAGTQVSGPVAHDNLAVYFVHGSAAPGAVPMSLEEALAKGRLKVGETGSVNVLMVENVGDDEVFIQAGDIVKGGRQDRVLSVDLLLPPNSGRVLIAAFCVEPGRATLARGRKA